MNCITENVANRQQSFDEYETVFGGQPMWNITCLNAAAAWLTFCADCTDPVAFDTSALNLRPWVQRRCLAHRRPGIPVRKAWEISDDAAREIAARVRATIGAEAELLGLGIAEVLARIEAEARRLLNNRPVQ